jgi:hypothetical protein
MGSWEDWARAGRRWMVVLGLGLLTLSTAQKCAPGDLSSEEIAQLVLAHGGPDTLADQVRGGALDGTQLARFPVLQQLVDQACVGKHASAAAKSPPKEEASEEELVEDGEAPEEGEQGGASKCLSIDYPPGDVHEVDDFEEQAEKHVMTAFSKV